MNPDGRGYGLRRPDEAGPIITEPLPDDTWAIRIWQRHPRFSTWAWASMRAVLENCRELELLGHAIQAAASSRLSAPIWFIPWGMAGQGPLDQTQIGQADEAQQTPFVNSITRHFEAPKKNPKSAAGVVPGMVFADREDIQAFKDILALRDIDHEAAAQRIECIERIATGFDMPTESLQGKGGMNHWGAWLIDEEAIKYHFEPSAQALMGALTQGYFRPHLAKMGIPDLDRYFMWYDATDLVAHPNEEKNYLDGFDRFAVSFTGLRRKLGIPEEDAPDDAEVALRTYLEIMQHFRPKGDLPTPSEILSGEIPVDEQSPGATDQTTPVKSEGPAAGTPAADPTMAPGVAGSGRTGTPTGAPAKGSPTSGAPPTPPVTSGITRHAIDLPPIKALTASSGLQPAGVRLASIERQLRLRLWQACDDQMGRTLERAGNRLRSLSNRGGPSVRSLVADIPKDHPELVGKALGPEQVEALGTSTHDLLAGAFDPLKAKWDSWVARAQAQGLSTIDEHSPDGLPDDALLALQAQQVSDRDAGWTVLSAALLSLAAGLVYDPTTPPPEQGEWSDTSVQMGVIRDALDAAGGGGTGGLLGGDTLTSVLPTAGLTVTSYTWEHGDPDRPFEPHEALDGVQVTGLDDDQLVNDDSFPETDSLFPGDHLGCTCVLVQDIAAADNGEGDITDGAG